MVDAHNTTEVEIESFTQHEVLLRPYCSFLVIKQTLSSFEFGVNIQFERNCLRISLNLNTPRTQHKTHSTGDWRLIDTTTTHNKLRVDAYYLTFATLQMNLTCFLKLNSNDTNVFTVQLDIRSKLMDDRLAERLSARNNDIHAFSIREYRKILVPSDFSGQLTLYPHCYKNCIIYVIRFLISTKKSDGRVITAKNSSATCPLPMRNSLDSENVAINSSAESID
jgi:hypothetical protein